LSLISQMVPAAQRKSAFALIRLAINLGMSVGPMLGAALAMWSFTAVFVVDGFTTLLAGVALLVFFRPRLLTENEVTPAGTLVPEQPATCAQFAVFLGATLMVAVVFLQLDSTVPLYLVNHLGLPLAIYGLAFTVNTLIIVILELWVNAATAPWPPRCAMGLGALLIALGFSGMVAVSGVVTFLLCVVVWTVGEMLLFPATGAYVAEISPARRRGTWMGLYTMSFNAGFAVAPVFGTLVLEEFGPDALWAGAGVLGVMAAAMYACVYEPARTTAAVLSNQPVAMNG
jgi:MFS family permease